MDHRDPRKRNAISLIPSPGVSRESAQNHQLRKPVSCFVSSLIYFVLCTFQHSHLRTSCPRQQSTSRGEPGSLRAHSRLLCRGVSPASCKEPNNRRFSRQRHGKPGILGHRVSGCTGQQQLSLFMSSNTQELSSHSTFLPPQWRLFSVHRLSIFLPPLLTSASSFKPQVRPRLLSPQVPIAPLPKTNNLALCFKDLGTIPLVLFTCRIPACLNTHLDCLEDGLPCLVDCPTRSPVIHLQHLGRRSRRSTRRAAIWPGPHKQKLAE